MTQQGNIVGRLWRRMRMNPTLGWGCEISADGVCVARWNGDRSGLASASYRPLTDGAVEVTPLRENLLRIDEVRRALSGCLEALGRSSEMQSPNRAIEVALVIPDQAARVFFLNFESFPSKPSESIPLLRWKLKKSVPFDIETSTISYLATRSAAGQWHLLTVVSPETIVRQYEAIAEDLGMRPRFVTLSTLGSLGLVPGGNETAGRFLLAKFSPPWLTTAIVHEQTVRLFRTAQIAATENGSSAAAETGLREILESIYPSAAYFQDNFGMPLEKAYLCGFGDYTEPISAALRDDLHLPAETLFADSFGVAALEPRHAERHFAALSGISRVRRGG